MRALSIAGVILFLAACTAGESVETANSQRARWESMKIDNYAWSLTIRCMACGDYPGPFTVKVVDGEPVDLHAVDYRGDIVKLPLGRIEKVKFFPLTVEELFDRLNDAYSSHAERVDVSYDATLGYPTHVAVIPRRTRLMMSTTTQLIP
jgi:hypothetical protein